jgi:hypothetical protein
MALLVMTWSRQKRWRLRRQWWWWCGGNNDGGKSDDGGGSSDGIGGRIATSEKKRGVERGVV